MKFTAKGTFTVDLKPQTEPQISDGVALGRMSLTKQIEGDLHATGQGEMLTARTPVKGCAGYVAIERVTGSLHGRRVAALFFSTAARCVEPISMCQLPWCLSPARVRCAVFQVPLKSPFRILNIFMSFSINYLSNKPKIKRFIATFDND